jgi:hypothetical protein
MRDDGGCWRKPILPIRNPQSEVRNFSGPSVSAFRRLRAPSSTLRVTASPRYRSLGRGASVGMGCLRSMTSPDTVARFEPSLVVDETSGSPLRG